MHTLPVTGLRQQAEMLASLSLKHLSSATRNKLADDDLSVNAYPTDCGGFVYVGPAAENVPAEPELIPLFAAARVAGIVWLKFDADAETVEGFETFPDQEVAQ